MRRLLPACAAGSRIASWALAAGLLGGCTGIEGDIKRAEMREFFMNIYKGRDRGAGEYLRTIRSHSTKPRARRYQHVPPAHISQFLIERAVRGLGRTEFRGPEDMAVATDQLVYVLAYDPAAATRSLAARELGRLYLRLPEAPLPPEPENARADTRINVAAQDLADYARRIANGDPVTNRQIVDRLEALRKERPPTLLSAQQMVRALASRPVSPAPPGPLRQWTEKVAPGMLRISILVVLREAAFGDPIRPEFQPDPSPLSRASAIDALARTGWDGAVEAAAARMSAPYDPAETDTDVLVAALRYLGVAGGPVAFQTCVVRVEDPAHAEVRHQAQQALLTMTGARVEASALAWQTWQAAHPEWQPGSGVEASASPADAPDR